LGWSVNSNLNSEQKCLGGKHKLFLMGTSSMLETGFHIVALMA
jgi:hypothetical protein